ncbi:MAG: hypothetical protein K6F28_10340 [Lachnospiraceae bacterium]|nr:hypothetical protein [Lachnospiraceae bacterium]
MNSDYILMFIDYLLIPFIAAGIDIRRSGQEKTMTYGNFLLYVSYTTALAVCVYIIRLVISRLGINIDTDPGTGIYTIFALAISLVMPYIKEIITTYVKVRCEIKGKKDTSSVEKK